MTTPQLLTVPQAAEALGIHRDTVYQWIANGTIPAVALPTGRSKTRIDEADLKAFIKAHKRTAA